MVDPGMGEHRTGLLRISKPRFEFNSPSEPGGLLQRTVCRVGRPRQNFSNKIHVDEPGGRPLGYFPTRHSSRWLLLQPHERNQAQRQRGCWSLEQCQAPGDRPAAQTSVPENFNLTEASFGTVCISHFLVTPSAFPFVETLELDVSSLRRRRVIRGSRGQHSSG
jgi:hypothetical protein